MVLGHGVLIRYYHWGRRQTSGIGAASSAGGCSGGCNLGHCFVSYAVVTVLGRAGRNSCGRRWGCVEDGRGPSEGWDKAEVKGELTGASRCRVAAASRGNDDDDDLDSIHTTFTPNLTHFTSITTQVTAYTPAATNPTPL